MTVKKMDIHSEAFELARQKLKKGDLSKNLQEQLIRQLDLMVEAVRNVPNETKREKTASALAQIVIDQHELLIQLQQKTAEFDAIKRISLTLTSSLQLSQVLANVVDEAMHLVPNALNAQIYLYHDGKLDFSAALNSEGCRDELFPAPRPNGLTYSVARKGEIIEVRDMQNDSVFKSSHENWTGSAIGIPLMMGTRVFGVMTLARQALCGFSDSETRLLTLLADQAAIAIVNARLHLATSQQARSDILTGLPNRRALDERLEDEIKYAQSTNRPMTVVMMDLDGFKAINDSFGHHVGDRVLREAFIPLAQSLRDTDFLARYGGDELTLVLHETGLDAAQVVIQKVQEKLRNNTIKLPDQSRAVLELSGGIAVFPLHGQSASELLRAADQALYHAKKTRRGSVVTAVTDEEE